VGVDLFLSLGAEDDGWVLISSCCWGRSCFVVRQPSAPPSQPAPFFVPKAVAPPDIPPVRRLLIVLGTLFSLARFYCRRAFLCSRHVADQCLCAGSEELRTSSKLPLPSLPLPLSLHCVWDQYRCALLCTVVLGAAAQHGRPCRAPGPIPRGRPPSSPGARPQVWPPSPP